MQPPRRTCLDGLACCRIDPIEVTLEVQFRWDVDFCDDEPVGQYGYCDGI